MDSSPSHAYITSLASFHKNTLIKYEKDGESERITFGKRESERDEAWDESISNLLHAFAQNKARRKESDDSLRGRGFYSRVWRKGQEGMTENREKLSLKYLVKIAQSRAPRESLSPSGVLEPLDQRLKLLLTVILRCPQAEALGLTRVVEASNSKSLSFLGFFGRFSTLPAHMSSKLTCPSWLLRH